MSPQEIIACLGLEAHPEGGSFREVFRERPRNGGRSAITSIYYLLCQGEVSAWHRLTDATEIWHHYAGAPLQLTLAAEAGKGEMATFLLGPDLANGERPQALVPLGVWQTAHSLGEWTLAGCTVAPGFEYSGFELARV